DARLGAGRQLCARLLRAAGRRARRRTDCQYRWRGTARDRVRLARYPLAGDARSNRVGLGCHLADNLGDALAIGAAFRFLGGERHDRAELLAVRCDQSGDQRANLVVAKLGRLIGLEDLGLALLFRRQLRAPALSVEVRRLVALLDLLLDQRVAILFGQRLT